MSANNIIDKLRLIDKYADEVMFNQIFGSMGGHIFRKHQNECEKRILNLWQVLDLENQRLLIKYLES